MPYMRAESVGQPTDLELSERELEYLKQIHNASALKELTRQPGWKIYQKVIADMVARLEDQHMNHADQMDRDAYWASGVRLAGVRAFAKILSERIAKDVDMLNHPLRPPRPPDPAELDGDQNGLQPEGDE